MLKILNPNLLSIFFLFHKKTCRFLKTQRFRIPRMSAQYIRTNTSKVEGGVTGAAPTQSINDPYYNLVKSMSTYAVAGTAPRQSINDPYYNLVQSMA